MDTSKFYKFCCLLDVILQFKTTKVVFQYMRQLQEDMCNAWIYCGRLAQNLVSEMLVIALLSTMQLVVVMFQQFVGCLR